MLGCPVLGKETEDIEKFYTLHVGPRGYSLKIFLKLPLKMRKEGGITNLEITASKIKKEQKQSSPGIILTYTIMVLLEAVFLMLKLTFQFLPYLYILPLNHS